ncbi:MAG: bifunctional riboflavin kinase/FAD synthetase [Coriobacteriia bacterium]|nr:bifunctional riboflavin kinase/FAD synthetase [Coriobacteriia bacterium]
MSGRPAVITHVRGMHELGPAVMAIGVFDGVHIGHQALVTDMITIARERHSAACVLTFDRDPDQVVTPSHPAKQLTTLEDKIALLSDLGPDVVLIIPFDDWLASLTPDDFCIDVLRDAAEPVACVVGFDFRFGTRASGDADTLRALGSLHGFQVITHPLVHAEGAPVTSTRIRALVARGEVAAAAALLGRPHRLRCEVVHGKRIGHELGTPTANLTVGHEFAVPATGVYAGWATVAGERYPAAISVGISPTFPDATCDLEAHLIGFDGDLYGQSMMLEFVERVREQQAFASTEALAQAIADDVAHIAALLGGG